MKNFYKVIWLLAIAAVVILVPAFLIETQAQNQRTKPRPKPTATPIVRQLTPSEIIYQNQDFSKEGADETENPPQQTQSVETENERLNNQIKELKERIKLLEANKTAPADEKEKRLLLNLDILTRAEQRAEGLRKQLIDLVEKENSLKSRLEQINFELRPEMINRSAALVGSLRPEDVRDARQKAFEAEKKNLENLIIQIETNRANLEQRVERADAMVEKIRAKFEKEIDNSLVEEPETEN